MTMARKLCSMMEKDGQNFKSKAPPLHHFRSSSFESEGGYLKAKCQECFNRACLQLPIRKVKVYHTDGHLAYTEYHRVFRDEEWPEPEDHATEENQTDADNQINRSLPGDQEGFEEQGKSDVLVTSLS